MKADDYGNGKYDTGIIWQRIENQAGYGNFKWKRRSDVPIQHVQLVYLGHVKIQLVNEAFQFASVDIRNEPNFDAFGCVSQ